MIDMVSFNLFNSDMTFAEFKMIFLLLPDWITMGPFGKVVFVSFGTSKALVIIFELRRYDLNTVITVKWLLEKT